ncbi:glutamate racemase [Candidatus Cyanaurora vandensis]|uniref:glutamate racemase n=1 Tax=Candidatus Cyanaurora vandensis TaxID=2714958 RepID=UPI00257B42E5|nr:glutamate racemase [Candidatus Cyanaurora vandensis]
MYPIHANQPIGIFDSGLGGLTVFRQLQAQLPQESVIYLADTARVPYGPRSSQEIEVFVREIIAWLLKCRVKMIIVACNTSTALVLERLRAEVPVPLLGLILPGARQAVQLGQRVAVLATAATVKSGAFQQAIQEADPRALVQVVACPEFVPLIEAGAMDPLAPQHPQLQRIVAQYLAPLQQWPLDVLVYGCTHYPLLEPLVAQHLGSIPRVDPARSAVTAASQELKVLGLTHSGPARYRFCVSGNPRQFQRVARPWLPPVSRIEQVRLPVVQPVPPEE